MNRIVRTERIIHAFRFGRRGAIGGRINQSSAAIILRTFIAATHIDAVKTVIPAEERIKHIHYAGIIVPRDEFRLQVLIQVIT